MGLATAAAIWLESALHGMTLRSNGLCQTAELAMVPVPAQGVNAGCAKPQDTPGVIGFVNIL